MRKARFSQALAVLFLALLTFGSMALAADKDMMMNHTTGKFSGVKVNQGTVTLSHQGMQNMLTLSDDFVDPKTPDPHWQVVDSKGTIYLLQKLSIKDDKFNKSIVVPSYIPDIAKVQIWCSFAEVVLGEASFSEPVSLHMMK